jgi:hypothetical protein
MRMEPAGVAEMAERTSKCNKSPDTPPPPPPIGSGGVTRECSKGSIFLSVPWELFTTQPLPNRTQPTQSNLREPLPI